jgi:hypothetical protein
LFDHIDAGAGWGAEAVKPGVDASADAARWTHDEVVKPGVDTTADAARWTRGAFRRMGRRF